MLKAASFVLGVWWVQHMARLPALWLELFIALFLIFSALALPRLKNSLSSFCFHLLICLAMLFAGIFWASSMAHWRLSDALPAAWQQKEVELVGVVASLPEVNASRTRFQFDVENIITPHATVPRRISLNLYPIHWGQSDGVSVTRLLPGERWQITVKLKRPHSSLNPHGFDFAGWALTQNIRAFGYVRTQHPMTKLSNFVWRPNYGIHRLRGEIQEHIQTVLKTPLAGMLTALVIGEDAGINQDTWELMLRSGISHLMSISGLHITMLSGLAFAGGYAIWRRSSRLLLLLPARKAAVLFGAVVGLAYALLAGFSVPTQRTFYMLMVFAVALWSGRQVSISQVLCAALIVVLLLDPWAVNAAGFWLSFGAVAVISIALDGRLARLHWFYTAVKTQWAVTLGLLPVLILLFHQASIISPIANALAIPIVSLVVTPLALLGGFFHLDWPLLIADWCLDQLMRALLWLDGLPIVMWSQASPPVWSVMLAMLSVLILLLPKGLPLRYLSLLGLLPMILVSPERPMFSELSMTVLAVGQGLSVHLQTKNHDLLYDAGPQYNRQSSAGERVILPYLRAEGVNRLDMMVLSHDDNDHTGGSRAILQEMKVHKLLTSFDAFRYHDAEVEQHHCVAGKKWQWDGVLFEMLYPSVGVLADQNKKDNDKSCVLKVTTDHGSVLLTGDIEGQAEQSLLSNPFLPSDVLLVPHHGSRTSSTQEFIRAVNPKHSIIANGYLNRFHHPNEKVLSRYHTIDAKVYRTDVDGAVSVMFKKQENSKQNIRVIRWQTRVPRYWRDGVESSL